MLTIYIEYRLTEMEIGYTLNSEVYRQVQDGRDLPLYPCQGKLPFF